MSQGTFIGDIAKQLDLTVKTIRYYEGLGLLGAPQRTESGYRVYAESDVERLRFIKGAKALGLSLAEIKEIVGIWGEGAVPCGHVEQMLKEKLAELDRRIQELVTFRDALTTYMGQLETLSPSPDVPCKHIEGAATGRWQLTPPEPVLGTDDKRHK
jgi:DNA-binding transcriptional MerR regulator